MASVRGNGWAITWNRDKLQMKLAEGATDLDRQMKFAFRDIAADIPAEIIKRMDGFTPGKRNKTSPIMTRTSKLAATVRGKRVGNKADEMVALIMAGSSTVKYAAIQEFGGEVTPKKAKALTIPLPNILTPGGDVKGDYRLTQRGGRHSTTGGQPTFIRDGVIMIQQGGKAVPIYALKQRAVIPPRLRMGKTIEEQDDYIERRIIEALEKAMPK
jgi:phage gpG-like protein